MSSSSIKTNCTRICFLLCLCPHNPKGLQHLTQRILQRKGNTTGNIVSFTTDRAKAMVGQHKGFISLLKNENPSVFTVNCVIHRQYLAAEKLSELLSKDLGMAIDVIKFTKCHIFIHRLFRLLYWWTFLAITSSYWSEMAFKEKSFSDISEHFDTIIDFLQRWNEDLYEIPSKWGRKCLFCR